MTACNKCGRDLSKFKGKVRCLCSPDPIPVVVESSKLLPYKRNTAEEVGPRIWRNLHSYKYTTEQEAKIFYELWILTIPSYGCSCKSHWAAITKNFPPDFSSSEAFFKWGVDAHNKVNDRLGKPQFGYQEAKVMYGQELCID
jgi:hypothetical protein